jgi:two-component system, cell cycle response regulator
MARDRTNERTSVAPAPQTPAVERKPFLLVLSGPRVGHLHKLAPDRPTTIGRTREADLCIDDDGVSRRHCTIQPTARGALLVDLGSQNGTFVEGVRIDQKTLYVDDRFQIGVHTTVKFAVADEMEADVQRRMAEAALREPLTGLYNRRHFQERFAAEVAVARRHERPLSLLVVDVDDFKQVNDRYGHLAGDEVLKTVARALQQGVRIEDTIARFGGEEFVALVREANLEHAQAAAERLRQLVELARTRWQSADDDVPVAIGVTISIGFAELSPGDTERDVFEAADQALYTAKRAGKNCVRAASARVKPAAAKRRARKTNSR